MSRPEQSVHMTGMTTATATPGATCDKVRDPLKDHPELAGQIVYTCSKPAGHDKRGAHYMQDDKGRGTHWRGADND